MINFKYHAIKYFLVANFENMYIIFSKISTQSDYSIPYIYWFLQFFHPICLFHTIRLLDTQEYTVVATSVWTKHSIHSNFSWWSDSCLKCCFTPLLLSLVRGILGLYNEVPFVIVPQWSIKLRVVKVWMPLFPIQIKSFHGLQTLTNCNFETP